MKDESTKRKRIDDADADEVAAGFVLIELDTSDHENKRRKAGDLEKVSGAVFDPSASQVFFTADLEKRCKQRSAQ